MAKKEELLEYEKIRQKKIEERNQLFAELFKDANSLRLSWTERKKDCSGMSRGGILTGKASPVQQPSGGLRPDLGSIILTNSSAGHCVECHKVMEGLAKEDLIPFEQSDVKFRKKVLREGLMEAKEAIAKPGLDRIKMLDVVPESSKVSPKVIGGCSKPKEQSMKKMCQKPLR